RPSARRSTPSTSCPAAPPSPGSATSLRRRHRALSCGLPSARRPCSSPSSSFPLSPATISPQRAWSAARPLISFPLPTAPLPSARPERSLPRSSRIAASAARSSFSPASTVRSPAAPLTSAADLQGRVPFAGPAPSPPPLVSPAEVKRRRASVASSRVSAKRPLTNSGSRRNCPS
ncbi:unnamed protein product, partial [Lampetra planeri]